MTMPIGMVDQVAKWTEDHAHILALSLATTAQLLEVNGVDESDPRIIEMKAGAAWLFDTFAPPEVKRVKDIMSEAQKRIEEVFGEES